MPGEINVWPYSIRPTVGPPTIPTPENPVRINGHKYTADTEGNLAYDSTSSPGNITFYQFTQGAWTVAGTLASPANISTLTAQVTTNTNNIATLQTQVAALQAINVAVPGNSALPTISGTLVVGNTLTVTNGTWTNTPTGYTYQWLQSGTIIAGANSSTYVLASGDATHTISCNVTAANAVGSAVVTTASTGVIAAAAAVPVNTAIPTISGTTIVGSVLTSTTGTWTGVPTSYAYQWKSAGTNVGTNASTYTLVTGDAGNTVTCTVTASNGNGAGSPAVSSPTVAISPAGQVPSNTALPVITGSATVGNVLTSSTGTWTNSPSSYAYQWKSAGSNVGTNANTYTPVSGDIGNTITVAVTATNGTGASSPATSVATVAVANGIPDPGGYTTPWTATNFRTLIPSSPTLSPNSSAYVAKLVSDYTTYYGTFGLNLNSSCPNRYLVHGNSVPLVPVTITGHSGTWAGTINVPIPSYAVPDPNGSDHSMIIWDVDNSIAWEFWVVSGTYAGGFSAITFAMGRTDTGTGVYTRGAAVTSSLAAESVTSGKSNTNSASGIANLGTLVTVADIQSGAINHATAVAMVSTNGFVAPALYTDGSTSGGVPEGSRFWMPRSVSMPAGLCPFGQMIFTSWQNYGFYIVDTAGAVVLVAENYTAWTNYNGTNPYTTALAGTQSYNVITNFGQSVIQQLVVLAHP